MSIEAKVIARIGTGVPFCTAARLRTHAKLVSSSYLPTVCKLNKRVFTYLARVDVSEERPTEKRNSNLAAEISSIADLETQNTNDTHILLQTPCVTLVSTLELPE